MPSFTSLHSDYNADPITDQSPRYLLHRGEQILALLLREHYNRRLQSHGEVWLGSDADIAVWGDRLAALIGTETTLPVYFYPLPGNEYLLQGHYRVVNSKTDEATLAEARRIGAPVPLSSIVYLEKVNHLK